MIRNLVILSAATLFALVLSEGLLRVTGVIGKQGVSTVDESDYAAIPGIFSPDRHVQVTRVPALSHEIIIDSLGYRGVHFPRTKPSGSARVFMTGDSFVFGEFVPDSAALPQQLERELGEHGCRSVRVINGGLGGSTIDAQAEMVRRALELEPDLVVLQFNENDIPDLADVTLWNRLKANRAAKSRFPLSVVYPVVRESALWNLALQFKARQRNWGARAATASPASAEAEERLQELRTQYEDGFRRLSRMLSARSIPLVATVFPDHRTVYGRQETDQVDWFMDMTRQVGVPAVNLHPSLQSSGLEDTILYLLPHDGHPGPEGYRIAASVLADTLQRSDALQSSCGAAGSDGPA